VAEFLDYDPLTGVTHYHAHDEMTGQSTITTVQDIEPLLERNRALAQEGATDGGIKKGWWLYASIPPVVQVKMRAKGIRLDDPDATKRIVQEINEHYPALKCTQKHDGGLTKQIYIPPVSNADNG
jgi:hypothetical protein